MVRADRRGAAGEALVVQLVPRELRLHRGVHRRVELAGDVRRRPRRPRRDVRCGAGGPPHRPRRPSALLQQPGRRRRQRVSVRPRAAGRATSSATSGSARRSTSRRSSTRSPWPSASAACSSCPTAKDDDDGVGTGKMDFAFDAIVSKEINERVELSGFGGMIFRGRSGRRLDLERLPLGLRRSGSRRARACGSPRNCTARVPRRRARADTAR